MPIYEYKCNKCGQITEEFQIDTNVNNELLCKKCGGNTKKIVSRVNTDLINNERYSNTMGVNPRQIKEAERIYPGSVYNSKGQLRIDNRKHKLYEAKRRGLSELD